ncbi:MAG: hypothetical protein QW273_03800 [Candidatus Pacearchaeota archaeon]
MITYSDIYETLRKERYSEELQPLPKNFILEVGEYFKEKKEIGESKNDLFSDVIQKEKKKLANAYSLFRELLVLRKKKILNLAFIASETGISKRYFENMLSFEKDLFESVVKALQRAEEMLNEEIQGENLENKFVLVRFLESVSSFFDKEGEELGPFNKGEIANLPKEIAEILEKEKKVEILKES